MRRGGGFFRIEEYAKRRGGRSQVSCIVNRLPRDLSRRKFQ